jgi:hypothetical protein
MQLQLPIVVADDNLIDFVFNWLPSSFNKSVNLSSIAVRYMIDTSSFRFHKPALLINSSLVDDEYEKARMKFIVILREPTAREYSW